MHCISVLVHVTQFLIDKMYVKNRKWAQYYKFFCKAENNTHKKLHNITNYKDITPHAPGLYQVNQWKKAQHFFMNREQYFLLLNSIKFNGTVLTLQSEYFVRSTVCAVLRSYSWHKAGKYQNCHLVPNGSFWFFLVLFLVLFSFFLVL